MEKDNIRKLVYILVAILVAVILVNLFIWLLPIILVLIVAYFIYRMMQTKDKVNKNTKKGKTKKTIIIDSE